MRGLLVALLLLPLVSLAAPDASAAARQESQLFMQQAYAKYPEIPAGYLEAQAWAATRWQHRIPEATRTHHDMPPVYGLFGLYGTDQYGFVDLVGRVADAAGVSREQLLASEALYVDAVAAFVAARIREYGLEGRPFEELRPIVELLSGIEVTSEATRYAVTSHAYEVYRTAGAGIDLGDVQVQPRPVDLRQVFTADELQHLQAETLVFDGDGAAVGATANGKKKSASFSAGSAGATEQIDVDYPGATWEEAYSYSSRSGSAITHVVVHTMQGSYAGSIAWFLNPTSQVSAHYLMRSSDGQITQMVRNADKAWHARNSNPYTIGIEHEGFVDNPDWYTDTMYEESAKLVAYTCNLYLIDCTMTYDGPSHDTVVELSESYTVMGHQHYPDQAHTDPGINWDWPRYHALINGGVTPPEVNRLPEASFTWSCNQTTCNFDASASTDADGAVVGFDWNFGGGQEGSGVTASNIFPVGGDYIVELAVTDDKGAVHTTRRSVRAVSPPSPPPPGGGGGGAVGPWLLLIVVLLAGCTRGDNARLQMPQLEDADYYWIASRIFQNETNGNMDYLAHWNAGEDFPSLGIGHFIWFPAGVDAPFDESFPMMLEYQKASVDECVSIPEWLSGDGVPDAPWSSKQEFDAMLDSERTASLREWLANSAPLQAQYIVSSFSARWNALQLDGQDKAALTELLQRLLADSQGLFAVIDYFNFKGLGSNPRERYAGEGWGLVQVLGDIVDDAAADTPGLVEQFSRAAEKRLELRVQNSPPERNEARWMPGWAKRVAEYRSQAPPLSSDDGAAFRVPPYVQSQSNGSVTITWLSKSAAAGEVSGTDADELTSESRRACELAYNLAEYADLERAEPLPFQHTVTIDKLAPSQTIDLTITQDGQQASLQLRTPAPDRAHLVVYGDSETEPESRGKAARWTPPGEAASERRYFVDQDEGYRQNLAVIASKSPDVVAIAGDLVESGGEQRDWDEFWRHNAALAATTRLLPAPGNHDYFGGPRDLGGYGASARAIAKYKAYFGEPSYYLHEQGPVALLVLDINNGLPERSSMDTNWYLYGTAPRWQVDSAQHVWLEQQLAAAQANKAFTFVMFHHAPYSSGIHGRSPGVDDEQNFSSGLPLRELTPLFMRYGVDAVFNGHDELYEHSAITGDEILANGDSAPHTLHYFTVGIGGDGLRGADPLVENPYRVFLADSDAPEVWSDDGVLVSGGKHYGHLDVQVVRADNGNWQARFDPVYIFPLQNAAGETGSFEARSYDDALLLERPYVD
jgi:N-acetyl-anhydromuramyl-L-alanine amidase AmpD